MKRAVTSTPLGKATGVTQPGTPRTRDGALPVEVVADRLIISAVRPAASAIGLTLGTGAGTWGKGGERVSRNGEQALVVADRHKRLTSDGDEPLTASAISAGGAFQINHT